MNSPRSQARFATTHWTVVLVAAEGGDDTNAKDALAILCQTYWYPLYAYIRRRGYPSADAEDLTQGFFARLLEQHSLARVNPERGRFRTFLLASLNHYLADQWDRATAARRDIRRTISLDAQSAESRFSQEPPAPHATPEQLFQRQWAMTLLSTVLHRLQNDYEKAGKAKLFLSLRFAITGDRSAVPYAQLAEQLQTTEPAVRVAVHRLRRRYRELLRSQIAQTVSSPSEIDEEIRSLLATLA